MELYQHELSESEGCSLAVNVDQSLGNRRLAIPEYSLEAELSFHLWEAPPKDSEVCQVYPLGLESRELFWKRAYWTQPFRAMESLPQTAYYPSLCHLEGQREIYYWRLMGRLASDRCPVSGIDQPEEKKVGTESLVPCDLIWTLTLSITWLTS